MNNLKGVVSTLIAASRLVRTYFNAILFIVLCGWFIFSVLKTSWDGVMRIYDLSFVQQTYEPIKFVMTNDVCVCDCDSYQHEYSSFCRQKCVEQHPCGNEICESYMGENYETCPSDCPLKAVTCGNGECEPDNVEDADNCSEDCLNIGTEPASIYSSVTANEVTSKVVLNNEQLKEENQMKYRINELNPKSVSKKGKKFDLGSLQECRDSDKQKICLMPLGGPNYGLYVLRIR